MKVVTFGDKPAPAMAQIALKQTAEVEKPSIQRQHLSCWGSHRNVYQHLRWGVTHKENMQFL